MKRHIALAAMVLLTTASPAAAAPAPREIFRKSGTGSWQGPPAVIAVAPTTVAVTLDCSRDSSNFLTVSWNGYPAFDHDSYGIEPRDGELGAKGESTLYPDEGKGYWEIASQGHCSWTIVATQG